MSSISIVYSSAEGARQSNIARKQKAVKFEDGVIGGRTDKGEIHGESTLEDTKGKR